MTNYWRAGLFGRSKSGKSTLMDRMIRNHNRAIVFDAIDERAANAAREGLVEVTHIGELQERVRDSYLDGFRFWFHPHYEVDLVQSLSDLSKFMLDIQTQFGDHYGTDKRPSLLLAVDEMADCYPNHTMKKGQDAFSNMCRMGRHKGIHLIGASQRPAEVSTKFRGQLERRFLFNLTEPADLRAITEMGGTQGADLAEAVRCLKPLEYIDCHVGEYRHGRLTF
ncbi:hypothetical protein [Kordiimonas sp.]|uniref:hypothetical protein n=1 Tax=Kordiimonas sp. TaxID=1970157 RepID=UPI003A943D33